MKESNMSKLTLQLPDDILTRLQSEAERQQIPLDDLVREVIENYLSGEDDEPTKEELLDDLRQSMLDALAGRTRPADEVIEELRRKHQSNADDS
jgi:predicted transcriptional regulator